LKSTRHLFKPAIVIRALSQAFRDGGVDPGAGAAGTVSFVAGRGVDQGLRKGEGAVKAFCMNCGSSLFGGEWPDGEQVSIRMGAFDDDPGIRPQFHTFVDDRAPWDTITDDLPQYPERRRRILSPGNS
jgi:hypothetical protein